MKGLTKAEILACSERQIVKVNIDEKKVINVKEWSGANRDQWEQRVSDNNKNGKISIKGVKALAICLSVCDDEGGLLFNENEIRQIDGLNAKVVSKLWDKICDINGIGDKDVEEMTKNSEGAESDGSGSN